MQGVSKDLFKQARQKYHPRKIGRTVETLLIAESPPPPPSRSFFYFENVAGGPLFRETMKVLFPDEVKSTRASLLKKFQKSRFLLIDVSEKPLSGSSADKRRELKKINLNHLQQRILREIKGSKNPRVILISKRVWTATQSLHDNERLHIFNRDKEQAIPFPAYGWQHEFREKLGKQVKR